VKRPRLALAHEARLGWLALLGGLPAVVTTLVCLWTGAYAFKVQLTVSLLAAGAWIACALLVRDGASAPLHVMSNLLAALREGDYSIRGRHGRSDDALGGAMAEVNALLDLAAPALREALLTAFLDRLSRPTPHPA